MKKEIEEMHITINHINEFGNILSFQIDDELILRKDKDNIYDDEAIAVYDKYDVKCGYVANSVYSVARGSRSSGRIYDKINDGTKCIIKFIYDNIIIAKIFCYDE